ARAALRAWRPDVVHAADRRAGLVAAGLRRSGIKVVHTYHGVPDDVAEPWFRGVPRAAGPSAYTRVVLAADAVVARAVHRTVVPAPAMGRFLTTRLRVPADRVTHIDNCVDLAHVQPPTGPVRRLVFVGLLVERKGLDVLLDALARPDVMPPDATLTVVGDGPARAAAEVRARALEGRVTFLGFRADVPDLLRHHDALVLPSLMEQQPLVVAEAMAAGKPVVATDTGGVADMLGAPGFASATAPAPADLGTAGLAALGLGTAGVRTAGHGTAGVRTAGHGTAGLGLGGPTSGGLPVVGHDAGLIADDPGRGVDARPREGAPGVLRVGAPGAGEDYAGAPGVGAHCAGEPGVGESRANEAWAGGLLAAPGDVGQLATRLRELFADPDPGRTGRLLAERARERFAPDVCARRHLDLYRHLMGSAPVE
ncbi:glycosyltransferase family 4 protein, partial [Saccharothrix hoggarensis]